MSAADTINAAVQKVQAVTGIPLVTPVVGGKLQTGLKLKEHSATDKTVDLDNLTGRNVIVGVPGAFTGTCNQHLPGYLKSIQQYLDKGVKAVYVVAVNDVFVCEAWKEHLSIDNAAIHIVADDDGAWTAAIGAGLDARGLLGNMRSKRYAMLVEDGVIKAYEVESDPTKVTVSGADSFLSKL